MLDLIARLEAATGPDRELDCRIYIQIYGGRLEFSAGIDSLVPWVLLGPSLLQKRGEAEVPAYTSSIDAALTLAPEGHVLNIGTDIGNWTYIWRDTPEYDGIPFESRAQSIALSICIAALKARHAISVPSNVRGGQE